MDTEFLRRMILADAKASHKEIEDVRNYLLSQLPELEKAMQNPLFTGLNPQILFAGKTSRVFLPLDKILMHNWRKLLADPASEWHWYLQPALEASTAFYTLFCGSLQIDLLFSAFVTGATCVLHKIGELKTTIPVYDIVCNEGAAEEKVE